MRLVYISSFILKGDCIIAYYIQNSVNLYGYKLMKWGDTGGQGK